jgi:hypothetical protein
MTTPDKNYEQDADALEALAGGIQEPVAEPEELVNPLGEPVHDRFTPLVLPSELGLPIDDPPPAEPVEAAAAPTEAELTAPADPAGAVASDAGAPVGAATADPSAGAADPVGGTGGGSFLGDVAAARTPTAAAPAFRYTPPRPTGFAALFTTAGLTKSAARRRARMFRIVMIPALVAVGLTLVASCFVTLIMLIVGNNSIGAGRLYIHQFGKYIVIAGLPLGAFLLMGAWLFYLELRKLKPIADEEDDDTGR